MSLGQASITALVTAALLSGCSVSLRRFPRHPVVWQDADQRAHAAPPAAFYSSYSWDGADNAVFRPFAEFWLFRAAEEAWNVNAMDEVPSSSWYQNRLAVRSMGPAEVARGACADDWDMPEPWTIVGGKPDGANPGFQIRDGNGVRYLMKTEGHLQPERPAAADVIGAEIYHAAGYWVPCNRVVVFGRDALVRDPEATIRRTTGTEEPLEERHVDEVLAQATLMPDGRFRASISQFIDGRPISPWRYYGTRAGDPNDVIPHEHRRELRGMYLLSAWTDHIDARQENTLLAWMETGEDGSGHTRHYMIDFGDCFGIIHAWDNLARRFGHSGYLDFAHMGGDLFSLGLVDRPWYHADLGLSGVTFGYYDERRFVADRWRPGYSNNAYDRATERDNAWTARIIARFGDDHIDAMVRTGQFSDRVVEAELSRILRGRRDKILERYLTRLSPLTWPRVDRTESGQEVCLQDVALASGIRSSRSRYYRATAFRGDALTPVAVEAPRQAEPHEVCVPLPDLDGASADAPEYLVLDLVATSAERETTYPARLHFYLPGGGPAELVGFERPSSHDPPRP